MRLAFQCLQLVVTDFLPVMPWSCLPPCVDTVAKFGSQTQELNISLTAIGLMVSGAVGRLQVSDYGLKGRRYSAMNKSTSLSLPAEHHLLLSNKSSVVISRLVTINASESSLFLYQRPSTLSPNASLTAYGAVYFSGISRTTFSKARTSCAAA